MEEPWAGLSERTLVAMVEQLFSHLLKILNICAHVLDDTPPGPAVKVTVQACISSLAIKFGCFEATLYIFRTTNGIHSKSTTLSSLSDSVPSISGHPPVSEQHPFPQSHP